MLRLEYPKNVSNLIFRGFLTLRIFVAGNTLVLKTINENEFSDIEFYSGITREEIQSAPDGEKQLLYSKFIPWVLTWSTLLINDHNVILERSRNKWFRKIYDFYSHSSTYFIKKLELAVGQLSAWYHFEMLNVERFSIEPLSRNAWPSYKLLPLNDERVTNFPGTSILGINYHQLLYRSYLTSWENRVHLEQQWDIAKFLGSFHDSKFIRKITNQDKTRRESERALEERILSGSATQLDRNKIYEELELDMVRHIRDGYRDEHDKLIEKSDKDLKIELLKERLQVELFSIKYGRKLRRKDLYTIGSKAPAKDLPLGLYDPEEANTRLLRCVEELNTLGKMATKLDLTPELSNSLIQEASLAADKQFEANKDILTKEKPELFDERTNIKLE